ncbi:hypothetical protein N7481_008438 [Penicillium waksmanii]|uniref:uncharacterized protein n=1 Tax=Penicillium waksmanii TaxID=69791 RepID=UPI0025483970|nr:uncharacterized protein N7481_008438 [Penicillium waksmanii]KAJ5981140.1 hypothetical protein N7481_008438 [Penicillium waksmanii]
MSTRGLLNSILGALLLVLLVAVQVQSAPAEHALEELYGTIKGNNLVKTGGTVHVSFDSKTAALYGTSEIYGCTVVVVLDGQGAVIGHYPQEYGSEMTMDNAEATQKKIITPLEAALDLIDFTTQTQAYIVHSSDKPFKTKQSIGYKAIVQALTDNDMSETNIHSMPYAAGYSIVGHRGKVVVQWELKEDGGARLKLYVQDELPVYLRDFDEDRNPCTEI